MEQLTALLDVIKEAIEAGKTITIKADDVTITATEVTANGVEVTME